MDLEKGPVSRRQVWRKWKQGKRTLGERGSSTGSGSGASLLGSSGGLGGCL